MGHLAAFLRPPPRRRNARKVPLRVAVSHLVAFPCSPCAGREQLETICLIQKPRTCDPASGPSVENVHRGMRRGVGQVWEKGNLARDLAWKLLLVLPFSFPVTVTIFLFFKLISKLLMVRKSPCSPPSAWAGQVDLKCVSASEGPQRSGPA